MKFFLLAAAVFSIFTGCASDRTCGCYPGRKGEIGPKGSLGRKGENGEKGEKGLAGVLGDRGPQGPKGDIGAPGNPGISVFGPGFTFPDSRTSGPTGVRGAPGRCRCRRRAFTREGVTLANDYYVTDEYGEPIFMGNNFSDQDIHSVFKDERTTPPPHTFNAYIEQPNNGLFVMGPNGVLIPVTNASTFELFSDVISQPLRTTTTTTSTTTTTTTTTTSTTTKRPMLYSLNNNIYILGPKGSLIPLNALGFKKPLKHDQYGPNDNYYSHAYAGNRDGQFRYKQMPTSSYNEWLRSILLGEGDLFDIEEDNYNILPTDGTIASDVTLA